MDRSNCHFCLDSPSFGRYNRDTLISSSSRAYLSFSHFSGCLSKDHIFITPASHVTSLTNMDEDVYEEMRNYQKCLISFWDSQGKSAIFVESVVSVTSMEKTLLGGGHHTRIECFAVPSDQLNETKSYFKKAFSDAEKEWSQHKKIISTEGYRGPRGVIPRNFPYIHVDFNLGGGMAHVIEDSKEFPRNFGREVMAGIMGNSVLDRAFDSLSTHLKAMTEFKENFRSYDWTSGMNE